MELKSIKVSEKNWKRLMKWRVDLGCKNLDELIERILKITKASEISSSIGANKEIKSKEIK
tara:strand:- start:370 stop:552 length:183 start_codon:yes stop_codon:yes gene_type:complete